MKKQWFGTLAEDLSQTLRNKIIKKPQVRVWVHPKKGGDDYYKVFKSFGAAQKFIAVKHKDFYAEKEPMLAWGGYEVVPKLVKK